MKLKIKLNDKPLLIELTRAASKAIKERTTPLLAEMELYFSCLVRKKVRFYEENNNEESVMVNDSLEVCFRPVMTQSCSISDVEGDAPPVTDFPIKNPAAYVPHWLRIDYRKGEWCGEFGYGK